MECPHCREEIKIKDSNFCPSCGAAYKVLKNGKVRIVCQFCQTVQLNPSAYQCRECGRGLSNRVPTEGELMNLEKPCLICGKDEGYTKKRYDFHPAREMRFSPDVFRVFICNNCGHAEFFLQGHKKSA